MASEHYQRAKDIFYEACDMDVLDRSAFVERECNGDSALREEIDRLLQVDDSGDFLRQPALGESHLLHRAVAGLSSGPNSGASPVSIGRYRVIRLIGEGGMGVVYEAQQDSPRRTVALKVIREASLSRNLSRRFEHEVEILGRLHHPGIAQIFDAGIGAVAFSNGAAAAVPYFAMEFVDGAPIVEFSQSKSFSDRQRLNLLAQVIDAVHYGHQRGVTHRDLKPGNVLVDSSGHAKIIDFGVAKITDADVAITTMQTRPGQLVGTLAYMSPEQVGSEPHRIDIRTDVYSLGVIGFELLTGSLPHDLSGKTIPEAARLIRDEDPSRLSSFSTAYRGDVETIIAKALQKEPERRYQSAQEFAEDIRRYLRDEPIVARPPTLRYQLGKFARRHKELVAGMALVFLVLIGGIVGTTIGLIHANDARELAEQKQTEAEKENRTAQRVKSILTSMFRAAEPGTAGGGRDVRMADLLERAAAELDQTASESPEVELEIRLVLGETFDGLGLFQKAIDNRSRALELSRIMNGAEHPQTLEITAYLANSLRMLDYPQNAGQAAKLVDATLPVAQRTLSTDQPAVTELTYSKARVLSAQRRYDEAITVLRGLLATFRQMPPSPARDLRIVSVLTSIGWNQERVFHHVEAEATLREALALEVATRPNGPIDQFGDRRFLLAKVVLAQGRVEEALTNHREALRDAQKVYGPSHPHLIPMIEEAIILLIGQGRTEEALPLLRDLMAHWRNRAETHPDKLTDVLATVASSLAYLGQYEESAERYREALEFRQKLGGAADSEGLTIWRAGTVDLGLRAHGTWGSTAILHAVRFIIAPRIVNRTPTTLDLDIIDWRNMTYRLRQWRQDSADQPAAWQVVAEGDRADLAAHPDIESGLFDLRIEAPTTESSPVSQETFIVSSDWKVDSYSIECFPPYEPDKWNALIQSSPHKTFHVPSLSWTTRPTEPSNGPKDEPAMYGLVITTTLDVPAGEYVWMIDSDDGIRMWVDDAMALDAWTGPTWNTHTVPQTFSPGPHQIRIEYWQRFGGSMLHLLLRPIEAAK